MTELYPNVKRNKCPTDGDLRRSFPRMNPGGWVDPDFNEFGILTLPKKAIFVEEKIPRLFPHRRAGFTIA